jgi:hypothetical protein
MAASTAKGRAVVLYDGLCNICNSSIRFTLGRVGPFTEERVLYASLQSTIAHQLLDKVDPGAYEKAFYKCPVPNSPNENVPSTSYVSLAFVIIQPEYRKMLR